MTRELFWLTLTVILTGVMWIPYVVNRCQIRGLSGAMANPSRNDRPQSEWATRMMFAHDNAVENLVIFATLVLCASALGISGSTIATAAIVYFWARVVHALAYTFAVPWVRTLAFGVGFFAQMTVAWLILTR